MSLHIKHRPDSLEDFIGNDVAVEKLEKLLDRPIEEIPHAFLFYGDTGCGKTTLGRILAAELGCDITGRDYVEVDSADFRGIDTIRDIRRTMNMAPLTKGGKRVWLLDECHKLTNDGQNALLKALEDPPDHVYFILCTTEPEKLLKTIKGRCSDFKVEPLDDTEMLPFLRSVCKKERRTISKEVLRTICKTSKGHPRNALVTLDQILDLPPESQLEAAEIIETEEAEIIELCRSIIQYYSWPKARAILNKLQRQDPEKIRLAVLNYFNTVLLSKNDPRAFTIMYAFKDPFYNNGMAGVTIAVYEAIGDLKDLAPSRNDNKYDPNDDVPF